MGFVAEMGNKKKQCSDIRGGGFHHPNLFLCGQEVLYDVRCVDGGVETLKALGFLRDSHS